jgi:hypothetical protein
LQPFITTTIPAIKQPPANIIVSATIVEVQDRKLMKRINTDVVFTIVLSNEPLAK